MRLSFIRITSAWISILLAIILSSRAFPQVNDSLSSGNIRREKFTIVSGDTLLHLSHGFLIEGTDSVWLNSMLLKPEGYSLNMRYGTLKIRRSSLPLSTSKSQFSITIVYRFLPFTFKDAYRHRVPFARRDTSTGRMEQIAKPTSSFNMDDLFGANLQKSGSLVRGFSLGTNRDLSLSSGFRMQMSGKIAENIDVVAALTDENIPLQPEGTTQTLQEIDKVFVEIRGSNLAATLGDFVLGADGMEFGSFSRKLQGAKGTAAYRNDFTGGELMAAAATTRGKFATNEFNGLDAVQGPYRLSGRNNERDIVIIAGTERVYLNGENMVRGENNDYTIDYANGEITFTSKRLISRVSRIAVDYEYTDRQYTRNLIAAQTGNKFFNDNLNFRALVVRESDDKDSPTELVLSDSDIAILAAAGADPSQAAKSGVDYSGQGKGQYVKVDTLILFPGASSPTPQTIYRYAPQDSLNAVYSVTFSYVGDGNGDYTRFAAGQYVYAGYRSGGYAPIRLLPLPESHTIGDLAADWQISPSLKISGEGAFSKYDYNQFSPLSSARQNGGAINASAQFSQDAITAGGMKIGSLQVNARERYIQNTFTPMDRMDQVEFSRIWNLENVTAGTQSLSEGSLVYSPIFPLRLNAGAGRLAMGDQLTTDKYNAGASYHDRDAVNAEYGLEVLRTSNQSLGSSTDWIREKGSAETQLDLIAPGVQYDHEYRLQSGSVADTGALGSFRYHELTPRILFPNIFGVKALAEFGYRLDDSLYHGVFNRASRTSTEHFEITPPSTGDLSSSIMLTLRDRKFTDQFRLNNVDAATTLLRLQVRYTPFHRGMETDWFYDASSERSAKNERVFQQVPKGTGNYIYLGDLNNNHIADENEFQLARFDGDYVAFIVPSDQFIPVTDLNASTRIRLNGNRLFTGAGLNSILSQLSSETSLKVNEKSTLEETGKIYFLHFGSFLNDSTTLDGLNLFTQDFFIRENSPDFSIRFHLDQKKSFTQYSLENERGYAREQSIRIKWHLVEEIANQIDAANKVDNLSTTQFSYRARRVQGSSLAMDWSYRPEQKYELGFRFGTGRMTNADTTAADLNDQSVRFTYSFETKGQLRLEFDREEALISNGGLYLPYELTGGRLAGKTWLWHLTFDYRVTNFIQSSVGYDGRSENGGSPIHTGRAEVKAFF